MCDTPQDPAEDERSFPMSCFTNKHLLTPLSQSVNDSGLPSFLFISASHGLCAETQEKGKRLGRSLTVSCFMSHQGALITRQVQRAAAVCAVCQTAGGVRHEETPEKGYHPGSDCFSQTLISKQQKTGSRSILCFKAFFVKMIEHMLFIRGPFPGPVLFC